MPQYISMTKITMTKKALTIKIPISIGFCPFFESTLTFFCLELVVMGYVLGGKVSSNKATLVRFNQGGVSSFAIVEMLFLSLIETLSFT